MEIKVLAFAICYSCVSYTLLLTPVVGGQNINSAEKTTLSPISSTSKTAIITQGPQVQIKCLGNDCNSGPTTKVVGAPAKGGLIAANIINDPKHVKTDPKPVSAVEDVTSVPRKGVDGVLDEGPSVPRKGVTSDHHAQSAKKELKDLSVQAAEASTTTTTTRKPTTSNDAFMNRNKTSNINNVLTTTTMTTSTEKSRSKPDVTVDEQDYITSKATDQSTIGTSLVVGLVCALVLMTVLLFVGLKRIESIRRRREYRRMNDFLIDGMYNDL